ncbi:sigma factor G inhibitor Gin [Paenibacillus aurantius]|uniref:Sigma factor G inhibitor Gin n=1 Tax=Paenibacillus aurantius TaxID=2918900 RepID=A0AA96LEA7_9BACL|nr:sigma factor G inhibitor Gin [Paenibacillus aurantius]WJH36348.1 sigma factor G inhibitor Gin [Paenibacillus sp. CC-CFT747]WNQ11648.1 sigma factor G inhibitor Gin [Paenibacillus aurantius]
MEQQTGGTCIICGETGREGIHIVTEFICVECEAEMVQTDVRDEKYPFFIHQMRQIWYKKNA